MKKKMETRNAHYIPNQCALRDSWTFLYLFVTSPCAQHLGRLRGGVRVCLPESNRTRILPCKLLRSTHYRTTPQFPRVTRRSGRCAALHTYEQRTSRIREGRGYRGESPYGLRESDGLLSLSLSLVPHLYYLSILPIHTYLT